MDEETGGCGFLIFAFLGLIGLAIYGDHVSYKERYEEKIAQNIVKVFYHENQRYTVVVNENNELKFIELNTGGARPNCANISVVTGISPNSPMYYTKSKDHVRIYVHSPDDLNGGEWDHGKFGRGQTKVVE